MRRIKEETSRRPRNRNWYLYALAVETLVPLRHKTVNGCLVKVPGLRCEPVPHVLHDVRSESFAPPSLLGDQKWRNRRERGLDCMEGDRVGRWTHAFSSYQSRDLHPWSSSGGQWTSALLSEPLFVTHATILPPVCIFQTPARFF